MEEKILSREAFSAIRENFRKQKRKVVLCHGVFDLLHYGHVEHLQEAKAQGDILVVSITSAKYVNKGPGRPYFNDQQRMHFLASLECVDYVLLSEAVTVHEIVKYVQPDVYVKGQEYAAAENDVTGNIGPEQEIVEKYGGKIYFTKGEVYSSTKLLNNFFGALPEDVLETSRQLRRKHGDDIAEKIRGMVESFADIKTLVVGDIIIDDYVFCKVQGLTTKDAAMSTRFDYKERYAGGSLAIARHLANFAGKVSLLAMTGGEKDIDPFIEETMGTVDCQIIKDMNFITPVKKRYLKQQPLRQEYEKLFSINRLLDTKGMKSVDYTAFYQKLEALVPQYDLVVICDYGHGLLTDKAIRIIEKGAKYLAVNCQTNSSNYGMNLITKYDRADTFVVDERELKLPFGQTIDESEELLEKLSEQLNSKASWVTQGAKGALGMKGKEKAQIPAVTLHVKDTVGAGDAFYALASLSAKAELPIEVATLLANIAGAIKTNVVGNSKPISNVALLKFMNTVTNV